MQHFFHFRGAMFNIKKILSFLICAFNLIFILSTAQAERIKDISQIFGIRHNQLVGYGLVVGLDGSGDSNAFTDQSFKTMLSRLGVQVPAGMNVSSKNVAAVAIHASLPPFARPGQQIDVLVSSIGSAKSLRGGSLLMAELKGADSQTYAVAQGNIVVAGFDAEGLDGSKIKVNMSVGGSIPGGAMVEKESPSSFDIYAKDDITYVLHRQDFTTARRMADVINHYMGSNTAAPIDGSRVQVNIPQSAADRVRFLSVLENLSLNPGEESAKVVINSKSGTIVIGQHVKVNAAAVSHGSLTVTISENPEVSQPQPFSLGTTETVENTQINIQQDDNTMFLFPKAVSLNSIVSAVNEVGASPSDLMAILEALKRVGALSADIEVI